MEYIGGRNNNSGTFANEFVLKSFLNFYQKLDEKPVNQDVKDISGIQEAK